MELLKVLLAAAAQKVADKRTSTKSGATGIAVTAVGTLLAAWPFYDQIKMFIANVCAQPDPADFIVAAVVGSVVTGVSMFVAARVSKTPANPGAL